MLSRTRVYAVGLFCAALALFSSLGCSSVKFEHQDVYVLHDSAEDRLELVIVYQRVFDASDDNGGFLQGLVAGRRHFVLLDWPFDLDLDSIDAASVLEEEHEYFEQAFRRRGLDFLSAIKIEDSGLFLDDEGRLCAWQKLVVPDVAEGCALLNGVFNRLIRTDAEAGKFEEGDQLLDQRTWDLWVQRARNDETWFCWNAGALEIDLPATPGVSARYLRAVMEEAADEPVAAEFFRAATESLAELRIEDERILLRFEPDKEGILYIGYDHPGWDYDDEDLEALRESGVPIAPAQDIEALRAMLGEGSE